MLFALFAASGLAGLIYETIWTQYVRPEFPVCRDSNWTAEVTVANSTLLTVETARLLVSQIRPPGAGSRPRSPGHP